MPTYLAIFGCAALIMIEVWLSERYLLKGMAVLAEQARTNYEFLMSKLGVQPPLADEKPQAVQVTIRPSKADWSAFLEFEESQRATLKEFEENT